MDTLSNLAWLLEQREKHPAMLARITRKTQCRPAEDYLDEAGVLQTRQPLYTYEVLRRGAEVGVGWRPAVADLLDALREIGWVEITQIKEKFGSLRVYYVTRIRNCSYGFSEEEMDIIWKNLCYEVSKAIDAAHFACGTTCESCGSKGTAMLRGHTWVSVLCNDCVAKGL